MQDVQGVALSQGVQHGSHIPRHELLAVGPPSQLMLQLPPPAQLHQDVDVLIILVRALEHHHTVGVVGVGSETQKYMESASGSSVQRT